MWSKTHGFSSEHPIVSQQPIQPSVDQVVEQISDLVDPTLLSESVPHVIEPMSSLVNPTLLSESDPKVIEPMSSLVNPTLPSESDFDEAVESTPVSINPTLPLESEVSTSHIFFSASSDLTKQGGTELVSDQPPPSPRTASFDWDSLVEPRVPSHAYF